MPLVSFDATDPTLSALQFPFFLQSHKVVPTNGWFLVDFYGSKEIAIFVDDDYARNGIPALDDELEKRTLKIAQKLPLPNQFDVGNITDMLNKSLNLNWSILVSMELVFDGTFSSPLFPVGLWN